MTGYVTTLHVMRVTVLPRLLCEALPDVPGRAFISITNPRQAPAHLPAGQPILRLGFHDIESPMLGWQAMTRRDAAVTIRFIESLPPETEELVVHCEYGASRSSAIGRFSAAWLGCALAWSGEGTPNPWVSQLLLRGAMRHAWFKPQCWQKILRAWRAATQP